MNRRASNEPHKERGDSAIAARMKKKFSKSKTRHSVNDNANAERGGSSAGSSTSGSKIKNPLRGAATEKLGAVFSSMPPVQLSAVVEGYEEKIRKKFAGESRSKSMEDGPAAADSQQQKTIRKKLQGANRSQSMEDNVPKNSEAGISNYEERVRRKLDEGKVLDKSKDATKKMPKKKGVADKEKNAPKRVSNPGRAERNVGHLYTSMPPKLSTANDDYEERVRRKMEEGAKKDKTGRYSKNNRISDKETDSHKESSGTRVSNSRKAERNVGDLYSSMPPKLSTASDDYEERLRRKMKEGSKNQRAEKKDTTDDKDKYDRKESSAARVSNSRKAERNVGDLYSSMPPKLSTASDDYEERLRRKMKEGSKNQRAEKKDTTHDKDKYDRKESSAARVSNSRKAERNVGDLYSSMPPKLSTASDDYEERLRRKMKEGSQNHQAKKYSSNQIAETNDVTDKEKYTGNVSSPKSSNVSDEYEQRIKQKLKEAQSSYEERLRRELDQGKNSGTRKYQGSSSTMESIMENQAGHNKSTAKAPKPNLKDNVRVSLRDLSCALAAADTKSASESRYKHNKDKHQSVPNNNTVLADYSKPKLEDNSYVSWRDLGNALAGAAITSESEMGYEHDAVEQAEEDGIVSRSELGSVHGMTEEQYEKDMLVSWSELGSVLGVVDEQDVNDGSISWDDLGNVLGEAALESTAEPADSGLASPRRRTRVSWRDLGIAFELAAENSFVEKEYELEKK